MDDATARRIETLRGFAKFQMRTDERLLQQ